MNPIEIFFIVLTIGLVCVLILKGEGTGLNRKIVFNINSLKSRDQKIARFVFALLAVLIFTGLFVNAALKQNGRPRLINVLLLVLTFAVIGIVISAMRSRTKK